MTLQELLAARKAKKNDLDKVLADETLAAKDRIAQAKALEAEYETLSADIKTAEDEAKDLAEMRTRNQARTEQLAQGRGRKTDSTTVETLSIGNPREAFEQDPNKGFKTPREYFLSVIEDGQRGGENRDPRLQYLTVGSDEARGNSNPAGGFLVPTGFSPNLLKIDPESDPLSGRTTMIPMAQPIVKIPARVDSTHTTSVSGGLTVTRRPETVAGTASQMTMSQVTLEAHNLMGLSYATEEILVDSPISFAALLAAGFSDQFTSHLINERINGTGIGEFMGVLTHLTTASGCTISQAKETGQAATTIVYENVINMRSRCYGYGKAVWLANHDTLPQLLLMNQAIGTGGVPVWQPAVGQDHGDMLLGRPIIFTEYCKTLGTLGDIILGNWSEYLEGTLEPLQSAESIHVRFVNHERAFKFWLRNAGQPWWKAALTPKNSSNTLSPFVVLATRA